MKAYENFISTREVAEITGYHPASIRRFVRTGKLKVYRSGPESYMKFKRSEVEKLMRSGSPTGNKK